jgi:hypothetical protein
VGGVFGAFVAALLSIPCAAALQVVIREIWRSTEPGARLSAHARLPDFRRPANCVRDVTLSLRNTLRRW